MSDCMIPKAIAEKHRSLLTEMQACPHGDGAHWPGDAGDIIGSLTIPTSATPLHANLPDGRVLVQHTPGGRITIEDQ
ncbi:hypothetical protein [Gordonia cholesterolivorans]|uniref:Uncharacterized protein n=1 Tax=Gordonia cholesterolivorans TaxID=559625 RepID=A0ABN3I555_9ACTN